MSNHQKKDEFKLYPTMIKIHSCTLLHMWIVPYIQMQPERYNNISVSFLGAVQVSRDAISGHL